MIASGVAAIRGAVPSTREHGQQLGAVARAGAGVAFTRVTSGRSGCLLALNDRYAFVAGAGPLERVDLDNGGHATIFDTDPALALALSDRTLYFRTAEGIHGIRLDAPPL